MERTPRFVADWKAHAQLDAKNQARACEPLPQQSVEAEGGCGRLHGGVEAAFDGGLKAVLEGGVKAVFEGGVAFETALEQELCACGWWLLFEEGSSNSPPAATDRAATDVHHATLPATQN